MSYIKQIKLSNFRNYSSLDIRDLGPGFVVLTGPNGAGKTNVLEAVSILSPGRGLRRARIEDLQKSSANDSWAVSALVSDGQRDDRIGTGLEPAGRKKRIARINGHTENALSSLGRYLSVFWLTPQMDSLFLDSGSERRRFLDRMILTFDPAHQGRMTRYEKSLSQRSKLLRDGNFDQSWLGGLESQMAETGVALAATRLDFIEKLKSTLNQFDVPGFPKSDIRLSGFLEDQLGKLPALDLEERFLHALSHSREADSITGGAAIGPHRSDFMLVYSKKGLDASQCSTGEQKILLTGLVLAHSRLVAAERQAPPLLLLDEVSAHLDESRRHSLYEILESLGGQVWLTGTDAALFHNLDGRYIAIDHGQVISE